MDIFNIGVAGGVLMLFAITLGLLMWRNNTDVRQFIEQNSLVLVFGITFLATIGSLAYSSLWGLIPCPLCWYQRIFMFPLPLLFLTALVKKDTRVWLYAAPLALIGLIMSGYQSLLQTGLFGQSLFCEPGSIESCSIPEIQVFGFVTIPLMSFVIFLFVVVMSFLRGRTHAR